MVVSAAVALTAHLNACRHSAISTEVAARSVVGDHAAHHVVDADGLLGLDPLGANELDAAIAAALLLVDSDWALALPRPGRLAPLTGPTALTTLAMGAGAVVLPVAGGPAWVPRVVGPAIQWQLTQSNAPRLLITAADADRRLRESILSAGRQLGDSPGTMGARPPEGEPLVLPASYGGRAQQLVDRAWLLMQATEAALDDERELLHVHAIEARRRALVDLRDAAGEALCAAVTWTGRTA